MPMGIVSDSEFQAELENSCPSYKDKVSSETPEISNSEESLKESLTIPDPPQGDVRHTHTPMLEPIDNEEPKAQQILTTVDILHLSKKGRNKGGLEVPMGLRKLVGEESVMSGRHNAIALADSLGISPSSVSAYAHGSTSTATYNKPDKELNSHLINRKGKITRKAMNKLMLALNMIDGEKLVGLKATELSSVAKDMASVVKQMEPASAGGTNGSVAAPQFHFYAPQIRNEQHYETIVAKDNY